MATQGKILVPLDLSTSPDETIRCAADVAKRFAWSVTLMHVYDARGYALMSGYVPYTPRELTELIEDRQQRLRLFQRQLESLGVRHVEASLLEGLPAQRILELASGGEFQLILMATHGKAAPWQRLIGLVAEDVLSDAPCPVMMVNEQTAIARGCGTRAVERGSPKYAH